MQNEELKELLHRIAASKDEMAFRALFDMYYQKLYHFAFYFLKSKELAEESVSDVFFSIWKQGNNLDRINDINLYLYTAVKNQCLHYIRRAKDQFFQNDELYQIELIPEYDNPETDYLEKEYQKLIQDAIDSLPDKCREVFRLVLNDKLKHREIAKLLDISEKTVESHVANAYKRIAEYVKKAIR